LGSFVFQSLRLPSPPAVPHFATSNPGSGGPVERPEHPLLVNLEADPSEKYEVSDSHPKVVQDLIVEVEKHKRSLKPCPPQR
jgi:hypothetical protein